MKNFKSIKMFVFIFIFSSLVLTSFVFADSSSCPELPYLTTDYINEHKNLIQSQCMSKGFVDEKCYEIANKAYEKFMNCFEGCGGYGDAGCEHLSMTGDCSYYECTTKIDNNCAKKCKNYLLFNYNSSDKKNNKINDDSDGIGDGDSGDNLIGLPINLGGSISPCVGATPKNSELCPGDDKEVFYYTEKHLTDSCSIPKGSEPKCEYVCKTEHLDDGTCKEEGFFWRIMSWFSRLFYI